MVEALAKSAEWFVRQMRGAERKPESFAIGGSPGCGKTHVARAILRFSQSYGPDILFAKRMSHWSSLWVDWPSVAESDDESDFNDMQHQIGQATMVVLDDVGSESDRFKSGISGSRLRRVLSQLENNKSWVVLTSNFSMRELVAFYDIRVSDRLRSFQWIEMGEVPSYRPKLKSK